MAADKEGIAAKTMGTAGTFFKGLQGNTSHRGAIQATMPMQLEAVLAKREKAEKEHKPARPPNVLVDGVYVRGSADPKQKPVLRHVIVKDLNKVAAQLKYEVPTTGLFERKPPMGLYCVFDGLSRAGVGVAGPASAELLSGTCPTPTILKLQAVFRVSQEVQATVPEPIKPAMPALGQTSARFCALNFHIALLNSLSELRAGTPSAASVQTAVAKSLETLDQELLIRNPEIADGCGAAVALLVRDHLFVAFMGRCTAVLCEVTDDGKRVAVRLGKGARAGGVGGAVVTSSPDVQTVYLESPERHPFLVLSSSAIPLKAAELLALADDFSVQPRAFCGEVASRASELAKSPCTAVQVNFLPEPSLQAEGHPPPAKKAKVGLSGPSGVASELILVKATQSMRLRHILVKFHEGTKPAEDPKAPWASRTRAEAERLLRGAISEIRQDRKSWTKTPKDVTELISLSSKKFIELCRKLSDCETAQKGALACGDLGWVAPEARAAMSEHFKEVCDILQPGQWSDIVAVGTRLYGLVPPARYQVQPVGGTIPPGKKGEPAMVELAMEEIPFNLRRFQEMEVSEGLEPHLEEPSKSAPCFCCCVWTARAEDWIVATKAGARHWSSDPHLAALQEIYTMAYYMDEQLLVDTGMISCVLISCASAKTALALAFCLRMRDMRRLRRPSRCVVKLNACWSNPSEHLEFARSTDLYHEVFTYDDVDSLPNTHTVVYMDFKCDGELRQQITLRMGTNLMYNMVIGPAVFQKKMKDQVFEKRAREVLFDESSWRERRRMVAEVTKTGRNEKLKHSYQAFIDRMKKIIAVKHVKSVDGFAAMYDSLYSNAAYLHWS
eukprot:s5283_g4.t8